MKKLFLLSISICFMLASHGQNYVDLAKLYYQNTPQNDFEDAEGSTNSQEFGADLTLPVKLESGNAVITGLSYNNLSFSLDNITDLTLQDLSLKLGMSINHSDKINATYLLLPKLSGDFNKIGSDDFQLGGVAILKIKKSENFKYKFGLYYNSDLFGPFFVPFVGCYYISNNEKFELDLSLPIAADLNYSIAPNLKIGFNYTTSTKSFNINEAPYGNTYVKKYSLEAFPYLRYTIAESFLIYAKVGYSIGREYEMSFKGDENSASILSIGFGDDPIVMNNLFKDGLIYRFGFRYRFNIKKDDE